MYAKPFFFAAVILFFAACGGKKDKPFQPPPLVRMEKSDTTHKIQKSPIINITDTVELKRVVLCIKDSSATSIGMSRKLSNIYNEKLPAGIRLAKLKATGPPMAWYKTQKPPFFFEAGIPVEKAPAKTPKGMSIKTTGGDSTLIAHYFGPIELNSVAYDALNDMLKDRGKERSSQPYEIYVKDPFAPSKEKRDPYKMETDIVFPYK